MRHGDKVKPRNIERMNERLNTLLQECDTLKTRLSGLSPLPAESLKKIEEAFAIEYTYESNRIEGNTLTLQETELVVNEGVTVAGKSMREHLEAINHAEAIDYIRDFAKNGVEISEKTIKEIHALILHGIDRENAGHYRPRYDFRKQLHAAATIPVRQANGGFYDMLSGNENRTRTPRFDSRLPAR